MRYGLLMVVVLSPGLATAQIYKWTDAQGRVHFDQRAVSGATPVQVNPQVIETDEATRERQQRTDSFYKARRDEQSQAEKRAAQQAAEEETQCRNLRRKLAQIPPGNSYYSSNAKGERVYYSDEQLDAARRQLSQQIAQRCR